ncbi:MAG: type II secretion system minor pseudopilin GspK [Hahellaceae bacterium]|nr:type II secretion system minor pseudopilin GspK [Hahellaceae bacterium]
MSRQKPLFRSERRLPGRQRGMVLILIVFIVALVTILAAGLSTKQSLDIRRATNIVEQNQARSYALGGEFFARNMLRNDWNKDNASKQFIDHEEDPKDEPWGGNAVQLPIDLNVGIEGQLDDLMGRINLNALVNNQTEPPRVDKNMLDRLSRLLNNLGGVTLPPELVPEHFVDWIDADQESTNFRGAEDDIYLLKPDPYRTGDTYFTDVSELWLIEGMTAEVYQALSRVVCVLPANVRQVNVNTASPTVLVALIPGLTLQQAQEVVEERKKQKGFKTAADFLGLPQLAALRGTPTQDIVVASNYFEATIRAIVDGRSYRMVSTLYRDSAGKVSVLRRDFGKKQDITKPVVIIK